MIDISKEIKNALKNGLVAKKNCEYYPCHFDGQDCTWCFCPFYPCLDSATGGKFTVSRRTRKKVWSCINCRWIHEHSIAREVLTELRKLESLPQGKRHSEAGAKDLRSSARKTAHTPASSRKSCCRKRQFPIGSNDLRKIRLRILGERNEG